MYMRMSTYSILKCKYYNIIVFVQSMHIHSKNIIYDIIICTMEIFERGPIKYIVPIQMCGKRFPFHKQFNILIMYCTLFHITLYYIIHMLYSLVFSPEQYTPEGSVDDRKKKFSSMHIIYLYSGSALPIMLIKIFLSVF